MCVCGGGGKRILSAGVICLDEILSFAVPSVEQKKREINNNKKSRGKNGVWSCWRESLVPHQRIYLADKLRGTINSPPL